MSGDDDFVRRWSRRKALARRQIGLATPDRTPAEDAAATEPGSTGERIPQSEPDTVPARGPSTPPRPSPDPDCQTDRDGDVPADLPDIESLTAESDFSPFMRADVPERLRAMALRKLWRLDPVLANVDGLVDYGEDFTDAATVIESMATAYRVGKGLLSDAERQAMGLDEAEAVPESEELETAAQSEADTAEAVAVSEPPEPAVEDVDEVENGEHPLVSDNGLTHT